MKLPHKTLSVLALCLLQTWALAQSGAQSPIQSSTQNPTAVAKLDLDIGEQVIDYDVSNDSATSWVIVKNAQGYSLKQWHFATQQILSYIPPAQVSIQALAIHPANNSVILLTRNNAGLSRIERLDNTATQWKTHVIYQTNKPLRRLMISAAKLSPSYLQDPKARDAHRIYFAQSNGKAWTTYSVRDDGSAAYSVIGADIVPLHKDEEWDGSPFQMQQGSTLPASLHPSGLALLVQDEASCFTKLNYVVNDWTIDKDIDKKINKDHKNPICGGFLAWSRNGLYLQHWRKNTPGVQLYSTVSDDTISLLPDLNIISPPSSLPDGQHLLVLTQDLKQQQHLQKLAVNIPAGDIKNAWMFLHDKQDIAAIDQYGGAFRPIDWQDWLTPQMYSLYDAEAYQCAAGTEVPKRPYLVSTDLFWENIAAAYEGLFILHERHAVIPHLDAFLHSAITHYATLSAPANTTSFAKIMYAAAVVRDKKALNQVPEALRLQVKNEVAKIEAASANETSPLTGSPLDYSEFKPCGHYDSDDNSARYFRAVRYLAMQKLSTVTLNEIKQLPKPLSVAATTWARSYDSLIAPSRATLAWSSQTPASATYARESDPEAKLFPLGWGFDNEIFHNTTYRQNWPKELQVSPNHPRALPSGLDIAAVLGSDLAYTLLQGDFKKFPSLESRIKALKQQAPSAIQPKHNLYHAWINALATEFATPPDSLPPNSKQLWQTKRLQTGLASWATLRHANVLVNDITGAQGGQGGFVFETVQHAPPRGGVEPDPASFHHMADLLEQIAQHSHQLSAQWPKTKPIQDTSNAYQKRIQEAAALLRQLADMAGRQNQGKELSAKEYDLIEKIGASAEHDFLLFKSVYNADGAMKQPDPIAKVADVAKSNGTRLLAAVGHPLEWDQSVGKPGARQLMRAAIYSYYEMTAAETMTDEEWREVEDKTARPAWIKPYVLKQALACAKVR